MARKFSSAPAATTLTDITGGGLPVGAAGTYLLTLANRGTAEISCRVAITTGAAAALADYVEYDAVIEAAGTLARWPLPLGEGWKVFVYVSGATVSASLIGLESA